MRLKDGTRGAGQVFGDACGLIRRNPWATAMLWAVLALLPGLLRCFLILRAQASLVSLWTVWLSQPTAADVQTYSLAALVAYSLRMSDKIGLPALLVEIARLLVLSPLLLSSQALVYNGYVIAGKRAGLQAVRLAGGKVRDLVIVALICSLAQWLAQMIPSIASGLLSLVAGLLSWIPFVGSAVNVIAVVGSLLVSVVVDFAILVIFCYVWICAACERVTGLGALVRSWQLTRNAPRQTVASLVALTLVRWLAVAVCGALWYWVGRGAGVPLQTFLYAVYVLGAIYTGMMGAVTSALYQRRPVHGGPSPGQFRSGGAPVDQMKRANL